MNKYILFLAVIFFILIFLSGIYIGSYKNFPFQFIDDLIINLEPKKNASNILDLKFDPYSSIDIKNKSDIPEIRYNIINYIWNLDNLPNEIPNTVEKDITDERFSDLNNLKNIDKFSIEMKNGVNSFVYVFYANTSNDELIIYHQGHSGGFINGKSTINYFLENGYSVMAFSMPFVGMNNQPIINVENIGPIKFSTHDQLKFLETENFSPLNYFFTPINNSLNYLDMNHNFKNYYMIGISGGGWSSTIYPAIDTRITKSFAVSGSLPLSLRINSQDIGDYEQLVPDFYKIANYLELYILSSYGENREFVQIFNKFDPCCFSGILFENYEDELIDILEKLNSGSFDIILDDTHKEHKISEYTLKLILQKIQ